MKLIPLPAFVDNYIWMLHDGNKALVVDPGDDAPVVQALQREGVQLAGILVTHHHNDHTGGVQALHAATGAPVYGPATENIPEPYLGLSDADTVDILGLRFQVILVPGHTAGHIAFYAEPAQGNPLLFCGDTLFSGGCGRLFEGTAAQMNASLQRLVALPDKTQVCCTHEYTLSNLKFACEIEPSNAALQDYQTHAQALRNDNKPTLPSNMALERQINPFLRCDMPEVIATVQRHDPQGCTRDGVFATLRQWKNTYR